MIVNVLMAAASSANSSVKVIAKFSRSAYKNKGASETRDYAQNVINMIGKKPKFYEAFAAKTATLTAATAAFSAIISETENGGSHDQVVQKEELKGKVLAALDAYENQMNEFANGVASVITGAGFSCWKKPESSELTKPKNPDIIFVKADIDATGCAIVKATNKHDRSIKSINAWISKDGVDYAYHDSLNPSGGRLTNLPRFTEFYLYFVAVGNGALKSEGTIPIRLTVL